MNTNAQGAAMATVLDAFALLALAVGEPASERVEAAIQRGDGRMSAVNLAETADQLVRGRGHEQAAVERILGDVVGEVVEAVPMDVATAWRATALRARHYHGRRSPLSLADCTALALALDTVNGVLATADHPLLRAAEAEGLKVLALPDGSGSYG